MIQSHRPDWVPGGRIGTHGKYTDGHERTFGEQDIFKNLAEEETDEGKRTNKEGCE